jgi:hypothetical protein
VSHPVPVVARKIGAAEPRGQRPDQGTGPRCRVAGVRPSASTQKCGDRADQRGCDDLIRQQRPGPGRGARLANPNEQQPTAGLSNQRRGEGAARDQNGALGSRAAVRVQGATRRASLRIGPYRNDVQV